MADTAVEEPAATLRRTSARAPTAAKPKVIRSHPSTAIMVTEAITNLAEEGGSSLQAIKKYIAKAHQTANVEKLAPFIRKFLTKAVESGTLVRTKGKGAAGSFKLGPTREEKKAAVEAKKAAAMFRRRGRSAGSAPTPAAEKPKPPRSHPPTSAMVIEAITKLAEKGGSSIEAIKNYIASAYETADLVKLNSPIRHYLKTAVESGTLCQAVAGKRASWDSFRFAFRPKRKLAKLGPTPRGKYAAKKTPFQFRKPDRLPCSCCAQFRTGLMP